jgi:hypothetical protein
VRGKIGFAGFTTANAAANWIMLRVTGAAAWWKWCDEKSGLPGCGAQLLMQIARQKVHWIVLRVALLLLLNRKMCLPGFRAQLQAKNSGKKLS